MAAARGVRRPGRRHGVAASTSRHGSHSHRSSARPPTSPGSPPGGSRSCRRATATTRTRRSPSSSGPSSRTGLRRRLRPRARSASSRAPARAPRSSWSPTRSSSSCAPARAPDEILVVCPSLERVRAPLETAFGALGVPLCARGDGQARRRPPSAARCSSLLRYAWLGGGRRDLFGVPALAVLRPRARPRRLPGRTAARPRHPLARAPGGGRSSSCAASRLRRWSACARHRRRSWPCARSPARCCGRRTGSTRLRPPRQRGSTCGPTRPCSPCWTSWRPGSMLGCDLSTEELVASLERAPVRLGAGTQPGRVAVLDLLRARTRRDEVVFVLGLEEGVFPQRTQSSPFLDDDRAARARRRRAGSRSPIRSPRARYLFYTACTRRVAPALPRPRGRHRRRRAARSRARSGRTCEPCSGRTTCRV